MFFNTHARRFHVFVFFLNCLTKTVESIKNNQQSTSMSAQSYKTIPVMIRSLIRKTGLEVTRYRPRGKEKFPIAIPETFQTLYKKYQQYSMIKWQGLYTAFNATDYLIKNNIEGDIVECGVWEGGCSAIIAEHLANHNDTKRHFYLYDTYEGMSEPTEKDYSFATKQSAQDLYNTYQKDGKTDWSVGSLDTVKKVMKQTGYPQKNLSFVKGKVEDTIPKTTPNKIALLRLDTDWYDSTKHELDHLFPKLVKGGILIVDDYGAWAGSKQAVDEYFDGKKHGILFHYDSVSGNICGVKQS